MIDGLNSFFVSLMQKIMDINNFSLQFRSSLTKAFGKNKSSGNLSNVCHDIATGDFDYGVHRVHLQCFFVFVCLFVCLSGPQKLPICMVTPSNG